MYFNNGNYNTASGSSSLYYTTTGYANTASGTTSLQNNTTGYSNTASGSSSGDFNDANNSCSFFGYDADQTVSTDFTNSTALGNTARIDASNQVRIGNSSVTSIGGFQNWSNVSDGRYKKNIKENVPGLEFIKLLKPITYTLDVNGLSKFLGEDITGEEGRTDENGNPLVQENEEAKKLVQQGRDEKSKVIETGFIAQDVEAAANKIGYDFSGVDKPQNENSLYGLRYAEFVVPLVKAVQELDSMNTQLTVDNGQLRIDNENQQKQIDELKTELQSVKSAIDNSQYEMSDGFAKLETLNTKPETILGQNIPNPFDNSTLIPFRIPKNCHDASIMITNTSTSEVLSVIPISCNEDHISINAGTLASGNYSYTLFVDGKMIDTRQMELIR